MLESSRTGNGLIASREEGRLIRQDLARAKVNLGRNDLVAALRLLAKAFEQYRGVRLLGAQRFEVEAAFDEALSTCNRHPEINYLLTPHEATSPVTLRFKKGREHMFCALFTALADQLDSTAVERAQEEEAARQARKIDLATRARTLLHEGDTARGCSFARRLVEDFGREDPSLYASVSQALLEANVPLEGALLLEEAIALYPNNAALYRQAIDCYTAARHFEEAEALYKKVLRQFGMHPRTLLHMAELYQAWGKRQKAVESLYHLLQSYPDFEEARAQLEKLERRL